MVEALKPFTEVKYVTKDGENISATKKDGIVTVVGDKNGVRQMTVEEFKRDLIENAQNLNLEVAPEKDTVSFQGKPDDYVHEYETEATTGKKWGVGIASWLLPGSGQAINNQWGKGVGFFALSGIGPIIIGALTGVGAGLSALKGNEKIATISGIIGLSSILLTGIGGRIWACVDAVKNAKSTVRVVDEKGLMADKNDA